MPHVATIGTYLPCWGAPDRRVAGDDEDAITLAVEQASLSGIAVVGGVAVVGAGMRPFAGHVALGIKDLLPMAVADCAASIDKGLAKTDLQADTLGLPELPVTRVENSCATGNDAVRNALSGVASGAIDVALVIGADKLRETASKDLLWEWEAMARDMAWDYPLGLVAPAGFALHVARYSHESAATKEHMAMSAVKNPSGGLKFKGHPPNATGVSQCVELVSQLRGQAANQVDGARIGVVHNIGGPTAVSAVTILEGPGDDGK